LVASAHGNVFLRFRSGRRSESWQGQPAKSPNHALARLALENDSSKWLRRRAEVVKGFP